MPTPAATAAVAVATSAVAVATSTVANAAGRAASAAADDAAALSGAAGGGVAHDGDVLVHHLLLQLDKRPNHLPSRQRRQSRQCRQRPAKRAVGHLLGELRHAR